MYVTTRDEEGVGAMRSLLSQKLTRTDISELESLARCSSSATVRELLRDIARTARDGEDIVAAKPSNAR